jgi:hypothetical protein
VLRPVRGNPERRGCDCSVTKERGYLEKAVGENDHLPVFELNTVTTPQSHYLTNITTVKSMK